MTFDPTVGQGAQFMDVIQLQATLAGYSLVDPETDCTVTPADAGGLAVDVDNGTAQLGGPVEPISAQSDVALPASSPDGPRKALVYLDATGSVQTLGGPAASEVKPAGKERAGTSVPTVPIPDEDFLPLAEVWIATGASAVSAGDIRSRRMPFSPQLSHDEVTGIGPDQHHEAFEPSDYNPEADTHSRPVSTQSVSGEERVHNSFDDSYLDGTSTTIDFPPKQYDEIRATVVSEQALNNSFDYTVEVRDVDGVVLESQSGTAADGEAINLSFGPFSSIASQVYYSYGDGSAGFVLDLVTQPIISHDHPI